MPTPDIDINYGAQIAKCHVCGKSATQFENVAPHAASGGSMRPVCSEHSMYQSAERRAAKERDELKAALLAKWEECDELKRKLALAEAVVSAVSALKPFIHERGMAGETPYERAVIAVTSALSTYEGKSGT